MKIDNDFDVFRKRISKVPDEKLALLTKEKWDEYDIEYIMVNAVREKDIKLLERLINAGMDVNKRLGYRTYNSYLDYAVEHETVEIAKLLIKNGLKFKCKDDPGYNAILRATNYGNLRMVQFLVENGADLNVEFGIYGKNMSLPNVVERNKQKEIYHYFLSIKDKFSPDKQKQLENMRIRMLF